MSGSPKYTRADLEARKRKELEEARKREAQLEAKRRAEAAERERLKRLQRIKASLQSDLESLAHDLEQQQGLMYPSDVQRLQEGCKAAAKAVQAASREEAAVLAGKAMVAIKQSIEAAISKKRRDDLEKHRQEEIARIQFEYDELCRRFQNIPANDSRKFDSSGRAQVEQALDKFMRAVKQGIPAVCAGPFATAKQAVEHHGEACSSRKAEWERRKADAEQSVGELQALLAGMQDDPVLMRWHGAEVGELGTQLDAASSAVAAERFEEPSAILSRTRERESQLVQLANDAQLKADQRDYIASAIVASLEQLGFFVTPAVLEDSANQSSDMYINARNASGKGISVTVPAEGDVWYDVNGFEMKAERTTEGGSAPTCDEAEGVLKQLHNGLAAAFGVQMGEVMWDGKVDPDRILRKADELPVGDSQQKHGGVN